MCGLVSGPSEKRPEDLLKSDRHFLPTKNPWETRRSNSQGPPFFPWWVFRWCIWVFPKVGVPQNGWWKSWKTLLKWMIWGVPLFSETSIYNFSIFWSGFSSFESAPKSHHSHTLIKCFLSLEGSLFVEESCGFLTSSECNMYVVCVYHGCMIDRSKIRLPFKV